MDAQQFLAAFGHIANAPGGVARLREMVYQFAVTGKLVQQKTEEGSGAELLKQVGTLRNRLISEKRFKRVAKIESTVMEAPKIPLPSSWCWTRLLDLGEINPRNDAPEEALATFVPMAAVSERHGYPVAGEKSKWGDISKGYTHFANGDVILAKITPCFENGKSAVISHLPHGIGAGSTEFHVFRPISDGICAEYVYLFLRSPLFRVDGEVNMTGTAGQKRLPTDYFALCPMPLPPTQEQSRIVAKVDELMALCDRLDAQQQARRKLQNALRQSTLQAMASATSPHELQEGWKRLRDSLGELFTAPGDVAGLREMVLALAIQGRLVLQQDSDEPAAEQLRRLRLAAAQQPSTGRRKKAAPQYLSAQESMEELPQGWTHAQLSEVVRVLNGRAYAKQELLEEGVPVLRVGNLFTSRQWYYSNLELEPEKYCDHGDLLYAWSASFGPFIWQGGRVIYHYHIWKLDFFDANQIDKNFLYLWLLEKTQEIKAAGHGISMAHMTKEKFEKLQIALPPLAEQSRIVAKVDELMALCDRLEQQLQQAQTLAEHYARAALNRLTHDAPEDAA